MGHDGISDHIPTGSSHKRTCAELYDPSRWQDRSRYRRWWHYRAYPADHLRSDSIEVEGAVVWYHQWDVCHWLSLGTAGRGRVFGKSDLGTYSHFKNRFQAVDYHRSVGYFGSTSPSPVWL